MGTLLNFGNANSSIEPLFESINMDLQSLYDAQLLLESGIDLSDIEMDDLISINESSGVFGVIIDTIKRIIAKIKELFAKAMEKFKNLSSKKIDKLNDKIAAEFEYNGRPFTIDEGIALSQNYILELEKFINDISFEIASVVSKQTSSEVKMEHFTDKKPEVLNRELEDIRKEIKLSFFNNEETDRKMTGKNSASINEIFKMYNSLNARSKELFKNQYFLEKKLKDLVAGIEKLESEIHRQTKGDKANLERLIKGVVALSISAIERMTFISRVQIDSLYEVGTSANTICSNYNMKVKLKNLEI